MLKPPLLYCATDKEIFDLLMSSKQYFGEVTLLDLARARGLILSPADERMALADKLSTMVFGFDDIRALQAEVERHGRGEKTTSFRLNSELTTSDIKQIAEEYGATVGDDEKLVTYGVGASGVAVDLKYVETDFSKTRLRQRQTKEARIEFNVMDGHTIVTLPATEKARGAAEALRDRLFARKQCDIGVEEVDLSAINDPRLRTSFFTSLISMLPDFKPQNVTRVKVDLAERANADIGDDEAEDDADEASQEMLGIVRAVALHGQSVLVSPEYQSLHKRGFFITSITWSSKRTVAPYQIVEFDAGFGEPSLGKAFNFNVRGWSTQRDGNYTKNFKPIPADDKKLFLAVIENTAIAALRTIKAQSLTLEPVGEPPPGVSNEENPMA